KPRTKPREPGRMRSCGLRRGGGKRMMRMLPILQGRKEASLVAVSLIAASLAALAVTMTGPPTARGEDRVPGLTGIDRADEVIQARQLLMDGIDADMMAI